MRPSLHLALITVASALVWTMVGVGASQKPNLIDKIELIDQVFIGNVCFEDDWCMAVRTEAFLTEDECSTIEKLFRDKVAELVAIHGDVTYGLSRCIANAAIDPKGRKA